MIKVLIADDVAVLRMGLKAVLAGEPDITVVGEAGNGKEAYELALRLEPDVVLMDMRMPDFDGSYGTRQIKDKLKGIKVLVLTTFDDKETVEKAMASGADGYILKEMDSAQVINSIKAVAGGINVFCDNVFQAIKKEPVKQAPKNLDLTEREVEFLRLICEGYDNKEIAAEYNIFSLPILLLFVDGKETLRIGRNFDILDFEKTVDRYYNMIFK